MGLFDGGFSLDGIVKGITDFGTKILGSTEGKGSGLLGSISNNPLPFLQTGLATIGALNAGEPGGYASSQEYLDKRLGLDQAELDQRLKIAEMQAAAAGGGSGAAIAAAKIAARSAMAQMKEKLLADTLAKKLELLRGEPELEQKAVQDTSTALLTRGNNMQSGFNQVANVLAGARR